MSGARRLRGGRIRVDLTADERELLARLTEQAPAVLASGPADPAVRRLLPDAYRGDDEAAEEFRRFTQEGLVERKLAGAAAIGDAVRGGTIELDPGAALVWVKALTDLRIIIATRLGIENDGEEGLPDPALRGMYDWLGYLQEAVVRAIDR